MFDTPTVLILGAGASMPYKFPSGRALLFYIRDSLISGLNHISIGGNPDNLNLVCKAISWFPFSDVSIKSFADALSKTMHPSIDAFLEMYPEHRTIGKVAIAASLIPFENPDAITKRKRDELEWYEYFFNLIRHPDEIRKGNLSVVTFNYDRSFEYFLYYAFMNSYHMASARAIDLMNHIPIVHIYGNLGAPHFLDKDGRDYETQVDAGNIQKCIEGIKIMPEIEDTHSTLPQVHSLISKADRTIFIGFSFHPVNVQRLKLLEHMRLRIVHGTVYSMMDGEINRVEQTLSKYSVEKWYLHKLDALNFLRETNYL